MQDKVFCTICQNEKPSRFCGQCKKETSNFFKKELVETINLSASLEGGVKRGEISWAHFPIAYTIILTLFVGIISLLEIICWILRVELIIGLSILFFYLCFFNDYFRKKIVWFFSKSKEHMEKIKKK
ncbi:hypothetical protein KKA09_02175 [Patescibacteria group bacterium]|nr:hypothetical protein [Patescibacteria group bacterium]